MAELCIVLLIWLVTYLVLGWVGVFLGPILGVGFIIWLDYKEEQNQQSRWK